MAQQPVPRRFGQTGWHVSTMLLAPLAAVAMVWCDSSIAQEEQLEEIIVTGSRLVRRDLDAPSPVVVIGQQDIASAGNVTLEETLNELPQLASDNTSSVNSGGGSGILTADLRGLDAVRTMVLVNGRRFAPADARGLTDLTSIPDALVSRVEVMTGGASRRYSMLTVMAMRKSSRPDAARLKPGRVTTSISACPIMLPPVCVVRLKPVISNGITMDLSSISKHAPMKILPDNCHRCDCPSVPM